MNERNALTPDQVINVSIIEIGGQIVQRDLQIVYSGRTYILSVGTKAYVADLKSYNARFGKDEQLDENILPVERVDDLDGLVKMLSKIPWEEVMIYLVRQSESDD